MPLRTLNDTLSLTSVNLRRNTLPVEIMRIKTYAYTAQEWPRFLRRLLHTHRHVCRVFPEAAGHPWNNEPLLRSVLRRQVPGYRGHMLAVAYDDYGQPLGFLALHLYDDDGPGGLSEPAFSLYDFHQAPTCPVEMYVELAQATGYCVIVGHVERKYRDSLYTDLMVSADGVYGYQVELPSTFDHYLESLEKKHRSSHRNVLNRYQHLRVESFDHFVPTAQDYELFNDYCDRWHETSSAINIPSRLSQMVRVFPVLPGQQVLRIYKGDRLVGVNLSYSTDGKVLQDHLFFYNRKYKGLGEFAILQNIQLAIRQGFQVYDLSSGDSRMDYKKRFMPKHYEPQPVVKIGTWVDAGFKDKGAFIPKVTSSDRLLFDIQFGEARDLKLEEMQNIVGEAHAYLNRYPALRKIVGPLTTYGGRVICQGQVITEPGMYTYKLGFRSLKRTRSLFSGPTSTARVSWAARLAPSVALNKKGPRPEHPVYAGRWEDALPHFQEQALALASALPFCTAKGPYLRRVQLPEGPAFGVFSRTNDGSVVHLACFHAPKGQAATAITQFARYWAKKGCTILVPALTPQELLSPPRWWNQVENVVWRNDAEVV